jgi:GNAT superfamily N-acetyltransferase
MFEEMDALRGLVHDPASLAAMDALYASHLRAHLDGGRLRAWVAEADGLIVASGAVSFLASWPPRPDDLTECLALLHSVYTLADYRQRGLARRIVEAAIEACRTQGMKRLTLHASAAGRPMYEAMGFQATNEMRLVLE